MGKRCAALLAGAVMLTASIGHAQTAAPAVNESGVTAYPASFFDQFIPNNAMEMIQKLPGFSFNGGDNVRGFAGAAGNVLIDGVRPSSKSVPLDQVIQRIPTKNVVRIEVIRGSAPGIDMQGLPMVANIVRSPEAEATTTYQQLTKNYTDGTMSFIPRVEQTYRKGRLSLEGAMQFRLQEKNTDDGMGRLFRRGALPGGEEGSFDSDVWWNFFQGNTTAEYRLKNNDLVHLNFGLERIDTDRNEIGRPTAFPSRQTYFERTRIKLRNDKGEISADYTHAFAGWLSGQIVGLKTMKRDRQSSFLDGRNTPQTAIEVADSSESIARASLIATPSARSRYEIGAEGALNSLDSRQALTVGGVPVVLPSAVVRVEEKRAEGFVTANLKPIPRMALELGVRHEVSNIGQVGIGVNRDRTFSFFKPRAILIYDPNASTQLRLRLQRLVGQLNFKDFAATSALDAGTVNAGNANLVPERSWVFEAAVEKRFWGGGSAVLTAQHQEVQEVVDLIPVQGFDAPGNIGDGTREELRFSLSMPLDKIGLKNTTVRFNGTWRWSRVTDPVTGERRRISLQRPFEGDFYIGKQFPKLKSTLSFDGGFGYNETLYRISEIRRTQDQPLLKIYWDWQPKPGLNIRLQAENITAKDKKRHRTLFAGPRSLQVATLREMRYAEFDPFLMIRIRKIL
jgi:outer membrane receptor protein involved in Fe transport